MTKPAKARLTGLAGEHSRMAAKLSRMLKKQLDALEAEPVDGFDEARVKALLLLSKTLQAMEAAQPETGKTANAASADTVDIVEFRRSLAQRIAALGDGGEGEPVPVGA